MMRCDMGLGIGTKMPSKGVIRQQRLQLRCQGRHAVGRVRILPRCQNIAHAGPVLRNDRKARGLRFEISSPKASLTPGQNKSDAA